MEDGVQEKPQMHFSALSTLWKCGERYRRRYVENEIIPPGSAMVLGTSTHKPAELNLKHKCRTDTLLEVEEVQDIARDTVNAEWDNGIKLSDDEVKEGIKKTKGSIVDRAVSFAKAHHEKLAPILNPISENHVEKKWVIEISGYPVNISGTMDVEEEEAIRDLKTSSKSPAKSVADDSDQLTVYSMAKYAETKVIPKKCSLDYIVGLKSGVVVKTVETVRDKEDFKVFLRRLERSIEIIQKGAFAPTDQSNWWCSPRWCGYALTCPFYRGKKQI